MLATIDIVLIFLYFAALLTIGYFTSKKQKEEDYLIAERNLGTWSTMATINASKTGSILMIFVALTFLWGFSAIWYFIGMIAGIILFIPFAMRLKEKSKQKYYTLADYFRYNYGRKAALFASSISIFIMFGAAIINIIAGSKIFVFFTGWPFWFCAMLMTFVIMIYLLLGGFKAVAKTDILQYIAIVFILVALTFVLFSGALIPASEWNFFTADIGTIIGFFLVGLLIPFASPDLWQRVYASRSKKHLRNGLILSTLVYAFVAFLLALVALTVKVKFPNIDPDLALIYGFQNLLPAGLVGLSVVLLFSAIMSSLDTYIFTGASAAVQDFFDWNKKDIIKNIKKVIFVFVLIATLIAILIQSLVIGSYIFIAFYCVLALPVIATWIREVKQQTLISGFIFGIIGLIIFLTISLSQGEVSPLIILATLASTFIGLLIGGVISFFQNK